MARFFQTWNIPGSSQFQYVAFQAKSRKEAIAIAMPWLKHLEDRCQLDSDIANGYSGELVSFTNSKDWVYRGGNLILSWEDGQENYYDFCNPAEVK